MNKEVIYLEPEDDITDILTKLQRAEQKLVALVPPKKTTILRSAVNMKLVAKAAKESDKVAVIVTADPALLKLAMAAKIPVAKTLQSRPVVPTEESVRASVASEDLIDEKAEENAAKAGNQPNNPKNAAKMPSGGSQSASAGSNGKSANSIELDEESLEKGSKDSKKANKNGKNSAKAGKDGKTSKFEQNRVKIIIGAVAGVLLIILLIWALVFAPAVDIIVAISTTSNNFAENVSFTTNPTDENVSEGKFYAEQLTYEQKKSTEFEATGKEDRGEKAKGTVTVSASFVLKNVDEKGYEISVAEGSKFTTGGKTFVATSAASAGWNGVDTTIKCDGGNLTFTPANLQKTCRISVNVNVEAQNSGEEFNVSANSNWSTFGGNTVTNSAAFSGGSTKLVTVVSRSDVDKAKESLGAQDIEAGKENLYDEITDDQLAIEPSYAVDTKDAESNPGIGSEAEKATLTAINSYSIYVVDKAKVEEFIKSKSELASDQRIYSFGEPYFERFTSIEESARLKATTETGPTVTEEEILEQSKGKKIGEVQSRLKSITGVSTVDIKPSFFWVSSVPNNPNKVTIDLTVEGEK